MRSTALIVSAAALIRVSAAEAQERGPLTDRFSIDAGMYSMDSDTTIRADSIDGIDVGSTLDLEDTFGFDEEMVFRLEGIWRFHKRHKLRLMYFDSKRTAHESIEQPISFAGEDFSIGLEVRTDFNFQILELAYEYAFLRRETYEIGASLGIHNVDFTTALTATLSTPGSSLTETLRGEVQTDAPLPVIGLRGNWNFAGNFYLQAHAQYFQLKYEGYDGSLTDLQAGVLWQFSRHVGAGIAYNLFDTDVDIDDGRDFQGELKWEYYGAQAYLRATF